MNTYNVTIYTTDSKTGAIIEDKKIVTALSAAKAAIVSCPDHKNGMREYTVNKKKPENAYFQFDAFGKNGVYAEIFETTK